MSPEAKELAAATAANEAANNAAMLAGLRVREARDAFVARHGPGEGPERGHTHIVPGVGLVFIHEDYYEHNVNEYHKCMTVKQLADFVHHLEETPRV